VYICVLSSVWNDRHRSSKENKVTSAVELTGTRKVPAGDISLALTEYGTGHPVVWLHGSGPGASGMSNFGGNLPAFADFHNFVFDQPRYGESDRPHIEGPLIAHSGEHILAALDGLGVDRFAVVGNSFGGGVGAWLAATAPDRVSAAVLMAPGGMQPEGLGPAGIPEGLQLIFKAMRDGVDRPLMERLVHVMLVDQSLATPELIDERLATAVRNNPEWEGMPFLGDLTDLASNIVAPTLLLWGRDDRTVPAAWSPFWLEQIADSELHVLPHCGHWLQYELRAKFNELAGEFLRSNTQ
jgi:4,5:9,10-diseco-3-hydroxy-5,9,17-trioxoandrosta-1(10),2-diene-4-oate hydrolase